LRISEHETALSTKDEAIWVLYTLTRFDLLLLLMHCYWL